LTASALVLWVALQRNRVATDQTAIDVPAAA